MEPQKVASVHGTFGSALLVFGRADCGAASDLSGSWLFSVSSEPCLSTAGRAKVAGFGCAMQGGLEFGEGPSGTRNFDIKIDEF